MYIKNNYKTENINIYITILCIPKVFSREKNDGITRRDVSSGGLVMVMIVRHISTALLFDLNICQ